MWNSLKKNFRLLKSLWALRKAAANAGPSVKREWAAWRGVLDHLWDEIEKRANDAEGLTVEEVVELLAHFLEHDLPELLGPPRDNGQGEPPLPGGRPSAALGTGGSDVHIPTLGDVSV